MYDTDRLVHVVRWFSYMDVMTKVRYILMLHFQFSGPWDTHRVIIQVHQGLLQVSRSCSTSLNYKFVSSKISYFCNYVHGRNRRTTWTCFLSTKQNIILAGLIGGNTVTYWWSKQIWVKVVKSEYFVYQLLTSRRHTFSIEFFFHVTWRVWYFVIPKLIWPTVRKNCSSDRDKLLKFGCRPIIRKIFEITRTICSNSESSEQFW